jgi:hypothetical protein
MTKKCVGLLNSEMLQRFSTIITRLVYIKSNYFSMIVCQVLVTLTVVQNKLYVALFSY